MQGIEHFKSTISMMNHIPPKEWDYLQTRLRETHFEKHEFLVCAGDIAQNFYFIHRGLARFFYINEDGKEFNKHFAMEGGFAGSFLSLVKGKACPYFIQAMEHVCAVILPNHLLYELYERHTCWERMGRYNAEQLLLFKEAREKEMLLDSLETRYLRFLEEFPGLVKRVPQYHIASYLGVTDVALSRIRRKINQG